MTSYNQLETRFRRIAALSGAEAVLHWDCATMMPVGGAGARAEQLAVLGVVRHEMLTDPALADLLDGAEAATASLGEWQRANLAEMRRRWRHANALPPDLVEALSKACSACEMAWRQARPANDFARVRPLLETVVSLTRESAAAKAAALGLDPYDALLDQYEPGGRARVIDRIFGALEAFLPGFLETVLDRQARMPPALPLKGRFPVDKQRALGEQLMRVLGFDFRHGRLDMSHHPFTGGVPDDVRLTSRYLESDFTSGLMAVLHETGHALYERGLPAVWRLQPVGEAMGMTVHESQSLIIEMQACRSDAFLRFLAPLLAAAFEVSGPAWTPENLARHYRRAQRGLIRVDADEVTYPLHVMLRYRLERAMIAGDLAVADLPGAWSDGMAALVGIRPLDDRDGCLQDIHWMGGSFGYFPTYTLGAVAAAQLFQAAECAMPELPAAIERGDFQPLVSWLRANVHAQGCRYATADELLRAATGRPLDVESLITHLRARYGG